MQTKVHIFRLQLFLVLFHFFGEFGRSTASAEWS